MKERPRTFMEPLPLGFQGVVSVFAGFWGSEKANLKSGHPPQNTVAKAWQLLNILWRFNA
jgi:hypothetical protein